MFMETAVMCYRAYVVYIFKASGEGFCPVKGPVPSENMPISEEMGADSFSSDGEHT